MSVEEAMSEGVYTNLRGEQWVLLDHNTWLSVDNISRVLTNKQVRTMVTRDQHRHECEGLRLCGDHPAPHAVWYKGDSVWAVWAADGNMGVHDVETTTHAEALRIAREWATGG